MAQISRHLIRAIMLLGISTSVKTQENSFLLIFHLNNLTQTVWLLCPLTHQVQTSNNLCGKLLERLTDEENWRGRGEYDSSLLQTILPTRRMIVWDLETTFLPWEWKEPWYCSDKTKKKKKKSGISGFVVWSIFLFSNCHNHSFCQMVFDNSYLSRCFLREPGYFKTEER